MMDIKYYALDHGAGLMKILEDATGINLYYFNSKNGWVEDSSLLRETFDAATDDISEAKAAKLAAKKGGKL